MLPPNSSLLVYPPEIAYDPKILERVKGDRTATSIEIRTDRANGVVAAQVVTRILKVKVGIAPKELEFRVIFSLGRSHTAEAQECSSQQNPPFHDISFYSPSEDSRYPPKQPFLIFGMPIA
jgi:hypothetical protein